MSSVRIERDQTVLREVIGHVLELYPIHFAGMAVFMRNDSDAPSTIEVHESADGQTWDLVLVSSHSASGLPSVTIAGLSMQAILFVSDQKYVRIRPTSRNAAGIYTSLVQYTPAGREPAVVY